MHVYDGLDNSLSLASQRTIAQGRHTTFAMYTGREPLRSVAPLHYAPCLDTLCVAGPLSPALKDYPGNHAWVQIYFSEESSGMLTNDSRQAFCARFIG